MNAPTYKELADALNNALALAQYFCDDNKGGKQAAEDQQTVDQLKEIYKRSQAQGVA